MTYKHIIFDVDGTMIDTECAILYAFQETLNTLTGKTFPLEELKFCFGNTGEASLRRFGIEEIRPAMNLWVQNVYHFADKVRVFDGIYDLLNELTASGYCLGVVTSETRNELTLNFQHFGLDKYFGTTICMEDAYASKPDPAPLFRYMELEHAKTSELLFIGDSHYDARCAKSAGVRFALAAWGSSAGTIQADYTLTHPLDLLTILNELNP